MASGDQFASSTDELVKNKHAGCSSCSDDDRHVVARHYCVDCMMYFCGKCLIYHNKMPSLKSHQVNDTGVCETADETNADDETEERGPNVSMETLRCSIHQGSPIDRYCKDHDEVFCGTCAAFKHRGCQIDTIANISKDFKSNPEVNACKDDLTRVHLQLKELIEKRNENIDCIGKQKLELIETVDKYEERLIRKIKQLANESRSEIRDEYEESKTELETDVVCLDTAMTATTEQKAKLEHSDNEVLLFAKTKTSKIVARDGDNLIQDMSKDWPEKEIKYKFDLTIEKAIDRIKSLRYLEDKSAVTEYEATYQKSMIVQRKNEEERRVYDMCFIEPCGLLVADCDDKSLKRFTSGLKFKDEIKLRGCPVAVCETGPNEVAVRIYVPKQVLFISMGDTMEKASSFTLDGQGFGITYDAEAGEIYSCENVKVSVYNRTGHKLRTYENNANGEQMFLGCRQIMLSKDKQELYVSDIGKKCVVVLNKTGYFKMNITIPGTTDPWSLCLLPDDTLLVGGSDSGHFTQIGTDGQLIRKLIESKNGIQAVYCVVHDQRYSRLIVGGNPGSILNVYTLSPI